MWDFGVYREEGGEGRREDRRRGEGRGRTNGRGVEGRMGGEE